MQPLLLSVHYDYMISSSQGAKVNKIGRPKVDTEAVMVRMPREMIDLLDDVRRSESDIPTRPEMLRRIFQEWLSYRDDPK